jgi:2-polyprenyl-3-methyl-5-hydroxy-6-metoxy-1,4-benzoquinol methylase
MNTSYKNFYFKKPKEYFSGIRYDIIDLIKCSDCSILELGCGNGDTLVELKKQNKAKFIVGVDIVDLNQSQKLDRFILADIENEDLNLPKDYFDVIICADVLEHLKDPWVVLKKLKEILKDDGILVASIPNIREIRTLMRIALKGDFCYVDSGILDKTHLRFFCKKNMIDMLHYAGFTVDLISFVLRTKRRFFNKITFGLFEEFLVTQYLIVAKKQYED